ncbi:hypothetical protein NliqN6_2914 [Naganishia liquefaciens]|uniref:Uncharacterized protein n=1 Tax=Naganishia liquefaciens TaxID=104408 RepID=A0A8H3TST0_9TREE|nr:hypothetical protein NliqN6_2914 [Naganishia liquefaciens]
MFRLLKEALAAPSSPPPPPPPTASAQGPEPPGKRIVVAKESQREPDAEALEEVKLSAEKEDWEVKRVIEGIEEWMKRQRFKIIQNPGKLDTLLAQLETLISLPPSAEHVTTPLAGFPPRLRIRQTIFRSEHGFEAIQRLLGVLTSTAALKTSVTGETEENIAAGELNVGDLALDDATATAGEGSESQEPTQQIATILRILHACLANHASRRHFDSIGGWTSLEPAFWSCCFPSDGADRVFNRSLDHRLATDPSLVPDLQVMGALWSLACNNEPSLMDLFERFKHQIGSNAVSESASSEIPEFPATLPISANLVLTHPGLLPIILNLTRLPYTMTARTTYPSPSRIPPHPAALTAEQSKLESLTCRILIVIIQSSWTNLFKTQQVLPSIYEAILKRLYGPSVGRRGESEMARNLELEPSRRKMAGKDKRRKGSLPQFLVTNHADLASPGGTIQPEQATVVSVQPNTKETTYTHSIADAALRPILLKLLRRLVEAGVPVEYAHMLFRLAKKSNAPTALAIIKNAQAAEEEASGPLEVATGSNKSSPSKSPAGRRTRPAKPMSLKLALNVLAGSARNGPSVLDKDILEVLRHGMSRRWPDVFMISPEMGGEPGGLLCADLGKPWPTSVKGYYFMAWVYVEHLCGPITLLHLYEDKRTLLRIRILPNSQVGVIATRPEDDQQVPEEVIFTSSESLVPHQKWIHVAVAGRRPRAATAEATEVKLLINGRRAQATKCRYPRPTSVTSSPGSEAVKVAIGRDGQSVPVPKDGMDFDALGLERSTWFLGHSLLLGEYIGDDLALLLYYLGPRYQSNMREALGRFLTYEGATALNIYLHNMVNATKKGGKAALPANSYLIKAIKQGHIFPEEEILLSYAANNSSQSRGMASESKIQNAAFPSANRSAESLKSQASGAGDISAHTPLFLDEAMFIAGGPAIALKIVELASTPEELLSAISLLVESVRESWKASEEIERMRGYDILAGLLRLKLQDCMTVPVFKTLYQFLGINFDKPEHSTVYNSTAYKALALRFDLWTKAPIEVLKLYFQHFRYLLTVSRFKRFNILHCLKKATLVRRILNSLKANTFDSVINEEILETLRAVLQNNWSIQDAAKPLLSYLIATLCSSTAVAETAMLGVPPTVAQSTALMIYQILAEVLQEPRHFTKLVASLPLHKILIIILSSNPFPQTVSTTLNIVKAGINNGTSESFEKAFIAEGGYDLLARLLPVAWSIRIQDEVFALATDTTETRMSQDRRKRMFSIIIATLDRLLTVTVEETPTSKPGFSRARSATSHISLPAVLSDNITESTVSRQEGDLEYLLKAINFSIVQSAIFRDMFTKDQVEAIIPSLADYISMSAAPISVSDQLLSNRSLVAQMLGNLRDRCNGDGMLQSQITALIEQVHIGIVSPRGKNASLAFSPSSISLSYMQSPTSYQSNLAFSPSSSSRLNPLSTSISRQGRKAPITRARSAIERKLPLMRRLTGDFAATARKDKDATWKEGIVAAESTRFAKTVLDSKDYWQRVSNRDWPRQLALIDSEIGLWPDLSIASHWRLDGSEGPLRKRIKLERATFHLADKSAAFYPRSHRNAIPRTDELNSAVSRIGAADDDDPFAEAMGEAFSQAADVEKAKTNIQHSQGDVMTQAKGEDDDEDEVADIADVPEEDEKQRRLNQTLATGDSIDEAFNISRVVGVDALPGLLIIGRQNFYLVDGLAKEKNGDIISASDAPADLFSIPSGTIAQVDVDDMQSHRWKYNEIVESNKRWYLFRDVAIEFMFADKRNFLCVLKNKRERQAVLQRIAGKIDPNAIKQSALGNFLLDTMQKAIDKAGTQLDEATQRWQHREISNFAYLQILNQFANRTPNDVTQYPVFPWVISDYTSPTLKLNSLSVYRDLNLPMGALTPARRDAANERYVQTELTGEKPFQFGTHYSSSMIVCSFNIRLSPFTEMFLALQGGSFDLADRLFSSVAKTWSSASEENRGDVRELIPELYYSPLMLLNVNRHEFGKKQVTEEDVDDVELPAWALGNALLFTHRHREALESDYVSRHLPSWIDLIFGHKQHDKDAFTCYHPLSYKNAIDLDAIDDEAEKAASVSIIHNCERGIFKEPHPHRYMAGKTTLPVDKRFGMDEHWIVLMRSVLPIAESSQPITRIMPAASAELLPRIISPNRLPFPDASNMFLHFGNLDKSMRKYHATGRLTGIIEYTDAKTAVFVNSKLLATASERGVISLWKMQTPTGSISALSATEFAIDAVLRGHQGSVNHLAASDIWSTLVSCGNDGMAVVWDMNRKRFLHRLLVEPEEPVWFATIDESEGHIALLTDSHLHTYTLNGAHIASAAIPSTGPNTFTFGGPQQPKPTFCGGVSFHQREFSKDGLLMAVGLGNNVSIWRLCPGTFGEAAWTLRELKRLPGPDHGLAVTAVAIIDDHLYAAFSPKEEGVRAKHTLYQWSLPEGGRHVTDNASGKCMADCGRSFGILEPRRYCGGCGGMFCSQDALQIDGFESRYCPTCRVTMALGSGVLGSRGGSRRGSSAFVDISRRGSVI